MVGMHPAMPTGASAPMRPICVVATSAPRLRINGCARSGARPLHWGPATKSWEGPLDTESLAVPGGSVIVRMAGVAEGDPVSDHCSATEKARPLDGVLAKPVADRIHRRLQARVPGFRGSREQIHLANRRRVYALLVRLIQIVRGVN